MKIILFPVRMILRLLSKILILVGIAVSMSTIVINLGIFIIGAFFGTVTVVYLFTGEYSMSMIGFVLVMIIGGIWYSLERLPEWIMNLSKWLYIKSLPREQKAYGRKLIFDKESMEIREVHNQYDAMNEFEE